MPEVSYIRQTLRMADGEKAVLDELDSGHSLPADAPLLLVLHGLSGSSDSVYIRQFIKAVHRAMPPLRIVVCHARGAAQPRGEEADSDESTHLLSKPLFYSAAFTNDIHEISELFRRQYPGVARTFSRTALNLPTRFAKVFGWLFDGCQYHCQLSWRREQCNREELREVFFLIAVLPAAF